MGAAMFISAAVGYVAALVATFHVAKYVVAAVILGSGPLESDQRRIIVRTAAAGGFVALLPALLLGIVVGGTLGSRYGVIGMAFGTFAVALAIMGLAIAVGAYLGRYLSRS